MSLYAKKKYYMYLLYKYKAKVEKDICANIPPYHQLEATFSEDDVMLRIGYSDYYIGYPYLDNLRRLYEREIHK